MIITVPPVRNDGSEGLDVCSDAPVLRISTSAPFAHNSATKRHHLRVQNPNNSAILTIAWYVVLHVVASSLSETGTKLYVESHTM